MLANRYILLSLHLFLLLSQELEGAEMILHERILTPLPGGVTIGALVLPAEDRDLPIVSSRASDAWAGRLRNLDHDGRANGFDGVLYDNRDRGHSVLSKSLFPRLPHLSYGPELVVQGRDYGLAGAFLLSPVVLGNSSTAITSGPAPRSLPRYAMTTPGAPRAQARLYLDNDLYIYPEHRDHDAEDLYPANWPYMVISQGSSGSDQPFLQAFAMTLAAFRPETFSRMRAEGLVASSLQVIMRRSLRQVHGLEDYFSGKAHPVVFDATMLQPDAMVAAAAEMEPEDIPPAVRLRVLSEDFLPEAGLASLDERLFDTSSAIARVWRSPAWEKEIVISAEAYGPGADSVDFTWRLLQGLDDRVQIEPLDPEGRRVRVVVRWHDAFAAGGAQGSRLTSRVDIAAFARRDTVASAPAFLSISFPTHELRTYGTLPDGKVGLLSVDYDAIARDARYDPRLHWSAPWIDEPVRDREGEIIAWSRSFGGGTTRTIPTAEQHHAIPDGAGKPVLEQGASDRR